MLLTTIGGSNDWWRQWYRGLTQMLVTGATATSFLSGRWTLWTMHKGARRHT